MKISMKSFWSRAFLVAAVSAASVTMAQSGSGTASKPPADSKPYVGAGDKSNGTSAGTTYNNGEGSTGSGAGSKGAAASEGMQSPDSTSAGKAAKPAKHSKKHSGASDTTTAK